MLYPALDIQQKKVVDIHPHGTENPMKEFVNLYNELTGQNVDTFDTVEHAKKACMDALHDRTFAHPAPQTQSGSYTPPWLNKDGSRTATPPTQESKGEPQEEEHGGDLSRADDDGPVAKARVIFEKMWGAPRKDVIEECARQGIKRSTASTQYQHFKKAKETAEMPEHRNPQNGMPQLPPGARVADLHKS
jgi:hypothetical protein